MNFFQEFNSVLSLWKMNEVNSDLYSSKPSEDSTHKT
jgi:hypothetical protein